MKENVFFGVIGCGGISRFHIHAIQTVKNAVLYGVYDFHPEQSEKAAQNSGCKVYYTLEEMLCDPKINAVCICTPSNLHFLQAKQALEHKKHILVEKPLAFSLQECDELIALAKKQGCCAGVVSQLRFGEDVAKVKNALCQNMLGTVTRCDVYMKYYRSHEYYQAVPWRGTRVGDGGGALMNQGIHGVDLVRFFMGDASSIYALSDTLVKQIETEDTLTAVVKWKNKAHGVIQASVADYPGFERRIEINGEYGTIVMKENKIIRWDLQKQGDYVYEMPDIKQKNAGHNDPFCIDTQGHIRQMENFVQSVQKNSMPAVTLQDGKNALELILAAYQSAKTNLPVVL